MKRIIAVVLAIIMVFSLAACGGEEAAQKTCSNCEKSIAENAAFCEHCGVATNDTKSEDVSSEYTSTEDTSSKNETVSTLSSSAPSSSAPSSSNLPQSSKPAESSKPTQSSKPDETSKPVSSTPTHKHSYSKKVTEATCTQPGYTTYTCSCGDVYKDNQISAKGHNYIKNVTTATCTEKGYTTYTCLCGDTYKADYTEPEHKYKKNVCTVCGEKHQNYALYQTEYDKLTNDYNSQVSVYKSKIEKSNENIEECQEAIDNARGTLYTLSPSCPQWYIQEYINNWQAFGNTYAATQAARNAWSQEYNSQRNQLNAVISTNTSKIQSEQQNISLYNSAISTLTTQYNNSVTSLKVKYGMN